MGDWLLSEVYWTYTTFRKLALLCFQVIGGHYTEQDFYIFIILSICDSAFLGSSPSGLLRCEGKLRFCTGLFVNVLSRKYWRQGASSSPTVQEFKTGTLSFYTIVLAIAVRAKGWSKCAERSEVHVEWGLLWPIRVFVQILKKRPPKLGKEKVRRRWEHRGL